MSKLEKVFTVAMFTILAACVVAMSRAGQVIPTRSREATILRAQAIVHGCGSDFQWSDFNKECFVDNLSIEIDCDTARAAQTIPHSIAVAVRWPDAEVGKIITIDVADAIGDEWRAYCESTEPEP